MIAEWASRTKPEGCYELSEYALANCTVQSVSSLEKCTVFFFNYSTTTIMDFFLLQMFDRLGMVPINKYTIQQIRTGETVWVKFPKKIGEYDPCYYMGTILAKLGANLKELDTEYEDEVSEVCVKFFGMLTFCVIACMCSKCDWQEHDCRTVMMGRMWRKRKTVASRRRLPRRLRRSVKRVHVWFCMFVCA